MRRSLHAQIWTGPKLTPLNNLETLQAESGGRLGQSYKLHGRVLKACPNMDTGPLG